MKSKIRIASGQGFWGDLPIAPIEQVKLASDKSPVDYMMMDYLAEVTMSIMQKQKLRDPKTGYARDLVEVIDKILPDLVEKNIKVITGAGQLRVADSGSDTVIQANTGGDLSPELEIAVSDGATLAGQWAGSDFIL